MSRSGAAQPCRRSSSRRHVAGPDRADLIRDRRSRCLHCAVNVSGTDRWAIVRNRVPSRPQQIRRLIIGHCVVGSRQDCMMSQTPRRLRASIASSAARSRIARW
jgi:hypothetical protein